MSVEVKNGVLYSEGVAIYAIPEAELVPAVGSYVSKDGTYYLNGVAQYRLANPHKVEVVTLRDDT